MRAENRLRELQEGLHKHKFHAVLVTHLPNIRYLCGFSGSAGLLLVSGDNATFFTDGRYTEQAREEVHGVHICIRKGKSAMASALDWLSGKINRLQHNFIGGPKVEVPT